MTNFLLFSFLDGFAQQNPVQSPISITKFQKSARMTCEIQTQENFDSIVIHWYKQKEGKAPERLLFVSGDKTTTDTGRYIVERKRVQKQCVLTIKDVIPDDAATYYCAHWDPHCDRNTDHQGKKPLTTSEPQGWNCATSPVFSLHLSELLKAPTIFCYSKRAGNPT